MIKPNNSAVKDFFETWHKDEVLSYMSELHEQQFDCTAWFPGNTSPLPERVGRYQRLYQAAVSLEWWDGKVWRRAPNGYLSSHQVGDYPLWRGIAAPSGPQKLR